LATLTNEYAVYSFTSWSDDHRVELTLTTWINHKFAKKPVSENDRELCPFLRLRDLRQGGSDSGSLLFIVLLHKWRPTALMLDEVFQGAHDT
jgi:hypothetical protein